MAAMHMHHSNLWLLFAVAVCLAVIEIRGGTVRRIPLGGLHSASPISQSGSLHVHRASRALTAYRVNRLGEGCESSEAAGQAGSQGRCAGKEEDGGDSQDAGVLVGVQYQGSGWEYCKGTRLDPRIVPQEPEAGEWRSLCSGVEVGGSIGQGQKRMRLRGGGDTELDARGTSKRSRSRKMGTKSTNSEDMLDGKGDGKATDEHELSRMDTEGGGRPSSEVQDHGGREGLKTGNLRDRTLSLEQRSFMCKMWKHKEYKTWTPARKKEVEAEAMEIEYLTTELIDDLKARMIDLLSWRDKKSGASNCTHVVPGGVLDTCFECTKVSTPPDHSRGGFACVLLDVENGIAFRLEPMKNIIDAAAWLSFHMVLEMFGIRAAHSVKVDKPKAVLTPDRMMSSDTPYTQWNHTPMVRLYQEPTLAAFSKHVVKQRSKILRKIQLRRAAGTGGTSLLGQANSDAGKGNTEGGEATQNKPLSGKEEGDKIMREGQDEEKECDNSDDGLTKGGIIAAMDEQNRRQSCVLTPRAWFWHPIIVPVMPEVENGSITENDRHRRVRGKELAEALCGSERGEEKDGKPDKKLPGETRVVKLLCSVFDLASTDLATIARSQWRNGAPDDVPVKVVENVGLALRSMHACAIAHGDVKMANILQLDDLYYLGDLPALTRATTKMLTNDPVCSTQLTTGKRMLANDMWGLGLITITLLAGSSPFKKACEKLRQINPQSNTNSGPLWTIFAAGFLHALNHLVPDNPYIMEAARGVKHFLQGPVGRKMIKSLNRESREVCRYEGDIMAHNILKHKAAPRLIQQLAYCMDIGNIARNALAFVLPSEATDFAPMEGQDADFFPQRRATE